MFALEEFKKVCFFCGNSSIIGISIGMFPVECYPKRPFSWRIRKPINHKLSPWTEKLKQSLHT